MDDTGWNIIENSAEIETPHGLCYVVRNRDYIVPYRVIGSSYRPQPGDRLDQTRYAYMGGGKTQAEALAAWDRQFGEDA